MVEASGLNPEKATGITRLYWCDRRSHTPICRGAGFEGGNPGGHWERGTVPVLRQGQVWVREGSAYNYIGSSSWIGGRPPANRWLTPAMRTFTLAHLIPGLFTASGPMITAGGGLPVGSRSALPARKKNLQQKLGISPYELMNLQVLKSKPGAKWVDIPPVFIGRAQVPRWNPEARAVFFGVKHVTHPGLIWSEPRLEGITYNLRVILEAPPKSGASQSHPCGLLEAAPTVRSGGQNPGWYLRYADTANWAGSRGNLFWRSAGWRNWRRDLSWCIPGRKIDPRSVDTTLPNLENKPVYDRLYDLFNRAYEAFVPLLFWTGQYNRINYFHKNNYIKKHNQYPKSYPKVFQREFWLCLIWLLIPNRTYFYQSVKVEVLYIQSILISTSQLNRWRYPKGAPAFGSKMF